jgi:hypothetical protein
VKAKLAYRPLKRGIAAGLSISAGTPGVYGDCDDACCFPATTDQSNLCASLSAESD